MSYKIEINGLNHMTFAVSNLSESIEFYKILFNVEVLVKSEKLAYFSIAGIWLALNVDEDIPGNKIKETYTHIAFSMNKDSQLELMKKLDNYEIKYELGRPRNIKEGHSIYIRDLDGHLIEFHDKTLADRIQYYKEEREDVQVLS